MRTTFTSLKHKVYIAFLVVLGGALVVSQGWYLLAPQTTEAAPVLNNVVNANFTNDTNPTYNAGSGTGRVLVVVIGVDDLSRKVNAVTYGGVAMTQAGYKSQGSSSAVAGAQIFYLINPASGSNTLSIDASAADVYTYIVGYVSGADAASVGTLNLTKGASSNNPNVDVLAQSPDSLIVAALVSDSTTSFSPSSGSIENLEASNTSGGQIRTALYSKTSTDDTSHNIGATGGTANWAAVGLEIKKNAVGTGGVEANNPVSGVFTSDFSYSYDAESGEGRALLIAFGVDDATRKVNSVTYAGTPMTEVYESDGESTAAAQLFYLANPAEGSNTVSVDVSTTDVYSHITTYVAGLEQEDPFGDIESNTGSENNLSVYLNPQGTGSFLVGVFVSDSTTAMSPDGTETEVLELANGVRLGFYTKMAEGGGEGGESLQINGGSAAWAAIGLELLLPAVTYDNTVSLTATDDEAGETGATNEGVGVFTMSRTGPTDDPLIVNYDYGGNAEYSDDYLFSLEGEGACNNYETGSAVTIPAGDESCTITVVVLDDDNYNEETEYVSIQLASGEYNLPEGGEGGGGSDQAEVEIYSAPEPPEPVQYSIDPLAGSASVSLFDDDTPPSGVFTADFTATPTRVLSGGYITLTWAVNGMTGCSINGIGAVGHTDTTAGNPHDVVVGPITAQTTYTLTCSDGFNVYPQTVTVGIIPTFIER